MKKYLAILLAAAFVFTGCGEGSAASGESKELNLMTFEGYVPAEVVSAFKEETGIKINYTAINDNESLLSKLQADTNSYDVLICSDYIIGGMFADGLIQAFDKSILTNFSNIDPAYQGQACDPENRYTIPYGPSIAIIAYDAQALDFVPTGYADFWRPELANAVVLLDGDRDIIGLTLQTLGYSLNETDPARLEEAKEKLLALKPNVIGFDASTPHKMLLSGEAKIGYMFGSQVTAAMQESDTIQFAYPEEGLGLYIDNAVLVNGAPNEANAYAFLQYILEGENSAAISNSIHYTNCNTAAAAFLSDEFKANATINIPGEFMQKAESYEDLGAARTLYSDVWTEFKSQ